MVQPVIRVVKRNGKIENLDISKIQKFTSDAVEGLKNVEQSELEVGAQLQFRDMITTSDIQHTLIQTAVDKIDIDAPDWTFVAARLFLYDLRHRVCNNNGYPSLKEYFNKGEENNRIVKGLQDKYDIEELDS
jgi:ribonucleoside-diphosphate reductase alpha chain